MANTDEASRNSPSNTHTQTRDRSPETWVFWVHASNAARFEQSFQDIADCVKIYGRQNPQANIFQLVHDWLRSDRKGKWVLILDNVDDASFLVKAQSISQDGQTTGIESGNLRSLVVIPPAVPEWIDSHNNTKQKCGSRTGWKAQYYRRLNRWIRWMRRHSLQNKLGRHGLTSDNTAELITALEFMPLAIVQAAVYIFRTGTALFCPRVPSRLSEERSQEKEST